MFACILRIENIIIHDKSCASCVRGISTKDVRWKNWLHSDLHDATILSKYIVKFVGSDLERQIAHEENPIDFGGKPGLQNEHQFNSKAHTFRFEEFCAMREIANRPWRITSVASCDFLKSDQSSSTAHRNHHTSLSLNIPWLVTWIICSRLHPRPLSLFRYAILKIWNHSRESDQHCTWN